MKVLCIVQARMGSERLPGKVMRQINGRPMITYTLERLKRSRYIDETVLATSDSRSDREMAEYLKQQGYHVFCGSECNVLERYVQAAKAYGGDIIIRITGDCPCIDPVILDHILTFYHLNAYDYVGVDTIHRQFVRGLDVEVFSMDSLLRTWEEVGKRDGYGPEKEHVTYFMYHHPELFRIHLMKAPEGMNRDYRLCVDTAEDFEVISRIYRHFEDEYVSARDIIAYLDQHPQVASLNREIMQKGV